MAIVHILDRKTDTILGTLNTSKAEYWSPLRRDSLENQNTFDFIANAAVEKSSLLEKRNRLLINDDDGFFREYIITYAEQYKRGEKIVRSNASFVDLAKAKIIEPQALQGATSATATDTALFGTEWQPGVIDYTFIRTINIEKYTNPLALLKLIASTFGLEIRYRVEVSGNKIIGRYVDMVKQIAGFEGKETNFAKDLIGVRRKEDSNPIVTALLGLGPEKEDGTFLTVLVEDVDALQRWGREGQHLIEIYEPQSSNQDMTLEELQTLTENELQKRIDAIVSYECEAVSLEHIFGRTHEKIRVGQTCRIKDDGYNPPLYLEARIQEVEVDQSTNQIKSFKIGNFIEYKKADLEAQISALKQIINEKISKMILSTVASSAGNIFKNGVGSTILTAKVFIAGQETDVDGSRYLYKWFKYDKDGALVTGFSQTSKSITVTSVEITEKATFVVEISTDKVISAAQTTITNVEDGKSLYTWVKYADDASGTGISDDPTGKGFIGFSYNKESPIESSIATDYVWNAIEGSQGVPGTSYYTWLKYATTPTSGMSDSPTGKLYMGLAMNKATSTESTNYADYTWSLIKGDQGDPGIPGVEGPPGPAGETLYTWIKYADNVSGSGMADLPTGKTYVGLAYNKTTSVESAVPSDYKWSLIKGDQGTVGPPGDDGQTLYTWIKYATTPTTGMSDDPTGRDYMGIAYNKSVQQESLIYADYYWSLIRGPVGAQGPQGIQGIPGQEGDQGTQGIQGPPGPNGISSYTHIAYATNATGTTGFSVSDSVGKTYIGMYVDSTSADSTDPALYNWSLIKGADGSQGIPGPTGDNGQTSYLHIAYATNATGTTGFSTTVATAKTYIGQYTDFVSADSTDPTKYSWTLIKGDKGDKGDTGNTGLQGIQGPAGDQGIQGPKGADGSPSYTHIAYATNSTGSLGFSVSDPVNKTYIGMYVDSIATDSTDPTKYAWSLIKGADGTQGIPGPPGEDGLSQYLHIAWSTSSTGSTGFSTTVSTGKTFIGTYTDFISADSTDPTKYSWTLMKGDQGDPGNPGDPGDPGPPGPAGSRNIMWGSMGDAFNIYNSTLDYYRVNSINSVKATYAGTGTSFGFNNISVHRKMEVLNGEDYTLSFDVRGNVTYFDYMYMMRASAEGANNGMGRIDIPDISLTEYKRVYITDPSTWASMTAYLLLATRDVGTGKWFEVRNIQIEEGSLPTAYAPNAIELEERLSGNEEDITRWKMTGKTTINGGQIETDSVTAVQISVAELSAITADLGKITSGEIEGVVIKLGQFGENGDLQVWADINNDAVQDVVGRIDVNGAYFPVMQADSIVGDVVNKYMGGTITLYFDSYNGDDAADGASWTTPKKNLQAYIDALPKYLNGKSVTLRYRGDMPAGLTIEGFHNGDLLISADTIPETRRPYVYGFIRFKHCTGGKFLAQGMDVIYDSTINGSTIMCDSNNCDYVQFYDVKCYGRNAVAHAFSFDSCNFNLGECHVYNITDRALNTLKMCRGYLSNCHGVAPIAILASEGSIITGVGTRWSGSLVRWTNAIIGTVSTGNTAWQLDPWTVDTAEGTPPTPPAPTSKTLFVSASTGDNHSSQGFWTNDEVKQGDYGYGNRIGIWYANFSAIKGKNIISATMTVHRETGVGNNAARPLRLISARATSRADRSTTINTANAKSISIAAGQTITVDITTLLEANIAAGLDNNIACYTTTGSVDYMSLGLTPSFAIEYI